MSARLQDTGLFTSRKRRTGEVEGCFKGGAKRPLTVEKTRYAGGGASSGGGVIGRKAAGAVAPRSEGSADYVQEAIHEEVQYSLEGKSKVPENTLKVFRFVKKAFVISEGFEKDHKYGPLSGVSHEVRVVSAYMAGQLKPRSGTDGTVKMCLVCGELGHFPRYCPSYLHQ